MGIGWAKTPNDSYNRLLQDTLDRNHLYKSEVKAL